MASRNRKRPKPSINSFPHEDGCKAYLQARRWREGVRCPRCGNPGVYDLTSRKWHWQCPKCAIHINTIEGFWSIFKRGVIGTFHKMSKKYMGFYVAEIRYNNRENGNTFGTAIKEC
jgi:hypothetical protein